MKIDLHTHILPRDWPDLDAKYGYSGFVRLDHYKPCCARMMIGERVFREITDNAWDPQRRIEEMDGAGVSMQVLSTVPVMFSYWAKPADALDLSRRLNDHIAEVVREHPTRFAGLATIPLQDPNWRRANWSDASANSACAARRSARTSMRTSIVTARDCRNLDHASLHAGLETAEQLGAAIFVHPWDMLGKERMPKYWLPWLVGMPAETSLAICLPDVRRRVRALSEACASPSRTAAAHSRSRSAASSTRFTFGRTCRASDNKSNPRSYLAHGGDPGALLRRFTRARCRRAAVAPQALRRATCRPRLGLPVPAGRSASRAS